MIENCFILCTESFELRLGYIVVCISGKLAYLIIEKGFRLPVNVI